MHNPTLLETMRADVQRIYDAAGDLDALRAIYLDIIGLECVDAEPDDGSTSADDVADILRDHVRAMCFEAGIHCAAVGL